VQTSSTEEDLSDVNSHSNLLFNVKGNILLLILIVSLLFVINVYKKLIQKIFLKCQYYSSIYVTMLQFKHHPFA